MNQFRLGLGLKNLSSYTNENTGIIFKTTSSSFFAHLGLKVSAGSAETTDFLRRYLTNKKQLGH